MIYFEDLKVGTIADYGSYEVTREEVLEFARKYDPQPFHLSDDEAAKTHFGRIAASGWHTAAMTMRLCVASDFRPAGGILGIGGELNWLKPVRPGDTLRVVTDIVELRASASKPDRGICRLRQVTINQRGEPTMEQETTVFLKRRPVAVAAVRS